MAKVFKLMMKIFALTIICWMALFGSLLAQNDPNGQIDTVYVDQISAGAGKECLVNVNLWNDEELGGVTIPISYPKDKLEFISLDFSGGRLDYIGNKPVTIDTSAGTILAGAMVFSEAYISPGNGPLFSLRFRVKDDLAPRTVAVIDSASIPPAYMALSDATAKTLFPAFLPGSVTVAELNQPPYFSPIPELYVAEGDSLIVDVRATDPEDAAIVLSNPIHPHTAAFTDNGDGTGRFVWVPAYVGSESSDKSPLEVVFAASDGETSGNVKVKVNVINVNRPPQITAPPMVTGEADDSLGISVSGSDPDYDPITWTINGLPDGATFEQHSPAMISWASQFADSGQCTVQLIATDPSGLADTADMLIDLTAVSMYTLRVDTIATFAGHVADIDVFLNNKLEISEYRLLISFDPSLLTPLGVTFTGTRSENFEYYDYRLNNVGVNGDVLITGIADVEGGPETPPIAVGDGPICRISVHVSSNLTYVGSQVPVPFIFRFSDDNTLRLADGTRISKDQIDYYDGSILIAAPGPVNLGDINLNGVAYEIGDAVYFSNFFISPRLFPMNDQQRLNSDINRDGIAPSVSDLVLLINIVGGAIPPPVMKPATVSDTATATLLRTSSGLFLALESPVDIGGALFHLSGSDIDRLKPQNLTTMDFQANTENDRFSCLLVSYDHETISSGGISAVKLSDNPDLDLSLDFADAADAGGRPLQINIKETAAVPGAFALHQNVPNPFNPSTEIRFDLAAPQHVTLSVYNILGQEVIRLADRDYPAGSHSVVWDGVDGNGRPVASGMYLYRIIAGTDSASRKMVLMK